MILWHHFQCSPLSSHTLLPVTHFPPHSTSVLSSKSEVLNRSSSTNKKDKEEDAKDDQEPFPPPKFALFITSWVCKGIVSRNAIYAVGRSWTLKTVCRTSYASCATDVVTFGAYIAGWWRCCALIAAIRTCDTVVSCCARWTVSLYWSDEQDEYSNFPNTLIILISFCRNIVSAHVTKQIK